MAIGGEWAGGPAVACSGGGSRQRAGVDRVPAGEATDIDRAVAAARRLRAGRLAAHATVDRERLLLRLAELVEAHAQELAEIEALDNGKPVTMARGRRGAGGDFLRYMAGWATQDRRLDDGGRSPGARPRVLRLHPARAGGRGGAIIPWNFPLLMVAWKAGRHSPRCTMVLKPAEETPLSALRFAELVQQAGYPAGCSTSSPATATPRVRAGRAQRASTRWPSPARPRSASWSARPRSTT